MKYNELKIIIFVLLSFGVIYLTILFFKADSIKVEYEPKFLYPDGNSFVEISVKYVNYFQIWLPFYKPEVEFSIEEGSELIEIVGFTNSKIILKSKYQTGKVVVQIKSCYTMLPIEIEIQILQQIT